MVVTSARGLAWPHLVLMARAVRSRRAHMHRVQGCFLLQQHSCRTAVVQLSLRLVLCFVRPTGQAPLLGHRPAGEIPAPSPRGCGLGAVGRLQQSAGRGADLRPACFLSGGRLHGLHGRVNPWVRQADRLGPRNGVKLYPNHTQTSPILSKPSTRHHTSLEGAAPRLR